MRKLENGDVFSPLVTATHIAPRTEPVGDSLCQEEPIDGRLGTVHVVLYILRIDDQHFVLQLSHLVPKRETGRIEWHKLCHAQLSFKLLLVRVLRVPMFFNIPHCVWVIHLLIGDHLMLVVAPVGQLQTAHLVGETVK